MRCIWEMRVQSSNPITVKVEIVFGGRQSRDFRKVEAANFVARFCGFSDGFFDSPGQRRVRSRTRRPREGKSRGRHPILRWSAGAGVRCQRPSWTTATSSSAGHYRAEQPRHRFLNSKKSRTGPVQYEPIAMVCRLRRLTSLSSFLRLPSVRRARLIASPASGSHAPTKSSFAAGAKAPPGPNIRWCISSTSRSSTPRIYRLHARLLPQTPG